MDDPVALARELIEIPSHADETAAGDRIERWLHAYTGANVLRDSVGNVIAHRGAGDRSLALVGHHDTVPPAEEQVDDGTPIAHVDDGRLYGRGSADMKGALAAMMFAFRDADPECKLVFASFVGEEVGGAGARHAVKNGFIPDYAVIGEGSAGYSAQGTLDLVVAHRGRRDIHLTARGTAAHASEVTEGSNAVYHAIDAIEQIRSLDRPQVEIADGELTASVAVTMIEGGTAMNVIPDRCRVTIDERTVPGETLPVESAVESIDAVEVHVEQDWPPMDCSESEFAEMVTTELSTQAVFPPRRVTKPHATDASWLAEAGTQTVVVGPAEPGEAHTDDESVSIDLLNTSREYYEAIIHVI